MGIVFDGVVLAAGHSSRMGRDKALLAASGGGPMWERQHGVLAAAGAMEVFLSARPEQPWTRGAAGFAAVVHDRLPGCGPIAGITAALERSARSHVAALAVDLPEMPAAWFGALVRECRDGVGAVGKRGEFFEPLAAIYPRAMMWLAWEALARAEYSLQVLLQRAVSERLMHVLPIDAGRAAWFENRNVPQA